MALSPSYNGLLSLVARAYFNVSSCLMGPTVSSMVNPSMVLLIFAAPALAMLIYQQVGRVEPLFLLAGLLALPALAVALRVKETGTLVSAAKQAHK